MKIGDHVKIGDQVNFGEHGKTGDNVKISGARGWRIRLTAAGAAVLVATLVFTAAGCGSGQDSPGKVTDAYLAAFRAGDEGAVKEHMCRRDRGGPVFKDAQQKESAATFSWKLGKERVHRTTAEVDFTLTRTKPTRQTRSETALLVSESRQWRVCGLRTRS